VTGCDGFFRKSLYTQAREVLKKSRHNPSHPSLGDENSRRIRLGKHLKDRQFFGLHDPECWQTPGFTTLEIAAGPVGMVGVEGVFPPLPQSIFELA
jgi:hypothetical protein